MTDENQEAHMKNKQELLQIFFNKYTDIIKFLQSLEINDQLKSYSMMNFDQGMFWLREGIVNMLVKEKEESKPDQESTTQEVS